MKRKQLNIRIPQSHIDRINELRGDLTQSEFVMRLIDEEWGREKKMSAPDLTAQWLYDLRDRTGFISGTDLHEAFDDLLGDMSPSGKARIEWSDLGDHWIADAIRNIPIDNPREFADAIRKYSKEEPTDDDGWLGFMLYSYLPPTNMRSGSNDAREFSWLNVAS